MKSGDEAIGNRVRVKVVKNKVAPPFRQAEFDIIYNSGISIEGGILDLGTKLDIINKSGTWYSYGEERMGQGRENSKKFLKDHPEIAKKIEEKIKITSGLIMEEADTELKDRAGQEDGGNTKISAKEPTTAAQGS